MANQGRNIHRPILVLFILSTALSFLIQNGAVYTTFTVYYPDSNLNGQKIYLRGDNCNLTWNKGVLLNRTATNQWQAALLCGDNATISVKALLNDTTWMFGGNKVFKGGDRNVDIYPSFNPSANKIVDKSNVASKILNNTRKCSIYYPPSYFENTLKKYEVLIMHDGQNLFNNSQAAFGTAWLIQNTINQLTSEGRMRQIIVVGVWNTPDRNNEYTYSYDASEKFGGKGDRYLDFLQKELIALLENDWLKGRIQGSYGIAGSSLGGLISCYASYTRPTVFPTSICMSPSFWWNSEDFNSKVLSGEKLLDGARFYLDSGDSGPSQDGKDQTVAVYQHLEKIGYKVNQTLFYYLDKGGQHSQAYWGRRFGIPLAYLYP